MRKNGFTLIELLAVIVILAIIALIATPIILGIINDAREESNKRSVELYASAVRNGIAAYQLTGKEVEAKTYKSSELSFVEYDGNIVCDTVAIYADGKIYVADCTVNGTEVEYTYGEQQITQVYKPQYYSWSSGNVGEDLPSDAKRTVAELNPGHPFYLGFDVEDGKVSAAYSCFVKNQTEYCLKHNEFATNTEIIKDAYSDIADTDACFFDANESYCIPDGLSVISNSDGLVSAYDAYTSCDVDDAGFFECYVQ